MSILCRTAKLDSTLQSNKKQRLLKMPSMRKSARDKVVMVSQIFVYFTKGRK